MLKALILFCTFLFSTLALAGSEFSGVEEIALKISKELGYSVDDKAVLKTINDMAESIKKESQSSADLPDLIIKKIYALPINKNNQSGFPEEEGLLPVLMSTGSGNCFSYSVLFLALGDRLGVNFRPTLIPGHVFLKYGTRNIETTLDGKNISDKDVAGLLYLNFTKTQFVPATRDQFLSGLYSNACIIAAYKGNLQKGLEYCDQAIKYNASNGEAFINKSFIEGAQGLSEQSLENAKQGVIIYPQLAHAYFSLGNAYKRLKKTDEAIIAFKKSISIRPNLFRVHYNLGNIYLDQQKLPLAIKSFNEAIRLNPDYIGAYTNRGIAYSMDKKYLQAIKDYTFLIKKNATNFDILFERGKAYYALKKYKLALADFETIEKQFPAEAKKEGIDKIILELKKLK